MWPQKAPQFVTTTFRRELMERADKVIGVSMLHKTSHLEVLERQPALEFITHIDVPPSQN